MSNDIENIWNWFNKLAWYWKALLALTFWWVLAPLYFWTKTGWSAPVKWAVTGVVALLFLVIVATGEELPAKNMQAARQAVRETGNNKPQLKNQTAGPETTETTASGDLDTKSKQSIAESSTEKEGATDITTTESLDTDSKSSTAEKATSTTQTTTNNNNESSAASTSGKLATVTGIVDGSTIDVRLPNGRTEQVRYIGIETLETCDPPGGDQGTKANRALVEGKEVRLVKDVSERDQDDRLLRYVYVGDVFVNAKLIEDGYAQAKGYPPDSAHAVEFAKLERQAKDADKGCWAGDEAPTSWPAPPADDKLF